MLRNHHKVAVVAIGGANPPKLGLNCFGCDHYDLLLPSRIIYKLKCAKS